MLCYLYLGFFRSVGLKAALETNLEKSDLNTELKIC